MDKIAITEDDNHHEAWYKVAREMTPEALGAFINQLMNGYVHDYGTIVHAIAACMSATMWACNKSEQGGITGFQANCMMWLVLEHAFCEKDALRLMTYGHLMYPQYRDKVVGISQSAFDELRKRCLETLKEDQNRVEAGKTPGMHPNVRQHMSDILKGIPPFGLIVTAT